MMSGEADGHGPNDDVDDEENWSGVWEGDSQMTSAMSHSARQSPIASVSYAGTTCASADMGSTSHGKQTTASDAATMGAKAGGATIMSRMALNDNKAGMQGLDREKINKIILEASKGSKFYENELKKEDQVNKRIGEQEQRRDRLTESQIQEGEVEADRLLEELESSRDLSRSIVHVDMDAFYAAVEMRDNPSLRDKPMAVGGPGMLSTSNYLARRYGVRAAMPGFIGKKLCPDLVIVSSNFAAYRVASNEVREIFSDYDPNFCPMSLDEAYLDLTEHVRQRESFTERQRTFAKWVDPERLCQCLGEDGSEVRPGQSGAVDGDVAALVDGQNKSDKSNGPSTSETSEHAPGGGEVTERSQATRSPAKAAETTCAHCGKPTSAQLLQETETFGMTVEEAVREMRFRIQQKTQLTASAGIAPNTMLSKVCSDRNKPNGQYRILPARADVMEFVKDLPIRKISGIGKVSEKMLRALDITNCQQLFENRGLLYHLYSTISFNYFMRITLGISSTRVERDGERKSMSTERTFRELSAPNDLYKKCYELCQSLSEDLQESDLVGKTVTLKIKLVTFESRTRAQTIINYTQDTELIYSAARELLRTEIQSCSPHPLKLRLMGVRMSNMVPASQLEGQKQETITGLFKKLQSRQPQSGTRLQDPAVKTGQDNTASNECTDVDITDYTCPICGNSIQDLGSVNKHVDKCLAEHCTRDEQDSSPKKAEPSEKHHPSSSESVTAKSGNQVLLIDNKKAFDSVGPGRPINTTDDVDCGPSVSTSAGVPPVSTSGDHSEDANSCEVFICPVCNIEQVPAIGLDAFNQHVDACLNRKTIRQIVQEQNREMKGPPKRAGNHCSGQTSKKRKTSNSSVRTLDSFFK